MEWALRNGDEIIEEFGTSHSINLDDAIELCGFEELEKQNIDDADYLYKGKKIWYEDLDLGLKIYWYAVLSDKEDTDWGTYGSFNRMRAIDMLKELNDGFEVYGCGERCSCLATIEAFDWGFDEDISYGKCIEIETEDDIF